MAATLDTTPATMKAFRLEKATRKLSLEEVEVPQPGPGEALIKIEAAGLCHSDVGVLNKELAVSPYAADVFTMGHEGCGTLVSLGPQVDPPVLHMYSSNPPAFELGARYAIFAVKGCMSAACPSCAAGQENICPQKNMLGLGLDGSWAPYAIVPVHLLVRVPDKVSASAACIATDAIVTPYHAIMTRGKVDSNSTVLILGLGGLGTNAVQIAKHVAGAKRVYASDLKEDARQLALTLGADEVFDAATLVQQVQERRLHITHVFDFVGAKPTLLSAMASVAFGGTVVLVGLISPLLEFPPLLVNAKEITLHGCFWGTQRELEVVLQLIGEGKIKPEVSERPLGEVEVWIERMVEGKVKGRVVFVPE